MSRSLAIVLALAMFGAVAAVIVGLLRRLRTERASQPAHTRSPLAVLIAIAAVIVLAATWYTDDVRAGFRLGLAGLAIASVIASLTRSRP